MFLTRSFYSILFFTLLLTIKTHALIVVVDAGHGGIDVGAVRDIFKESEITLKIAQKIEQFAQQNHAHEFQVKLTRNRNMSLSLEKRVAFAESQNADLFISLHANSASVGNPKGMEFYFKRGIRPTPVMQTSQTIALTKIENPILQKIINEVVDFGQTKQSLKFNQILQTNVASTNNSTKTVIKRAPYYVIEKTRMPAVLIEVGYISNLSEAKELLTDERQSEIAQTVVKTILDFKSQL